MRAESTPNIRTCFIMMLLPTGVNQGKATLAIGHKIRALKGRVKETGRQGDWATFAENRKPGSEKSI